MKKTLTIGSILIIGFIAGVFSTLNLFTINIDSLGIPYSNIPVITNKNITINQGNIEISLPAGTILTYNYSTKSVPIYSLSIVGNIGDAVFNETPNTEYFLQMKSTRIKAANKSIKFARKKALAWTPQKTLRHSFWTLRL